MQIRTKPQRPPVILKTPEDIAIMREAGIIVARAHRAMREALREGITTLELDTIAEAVIRDYGAEPTFLNYAPNNHIPFPATITACINDELVHGIPSKDRVIKAGDIVSLDTACVYKGFVGDAAYTYAIGAVSPAAQRLIERTKEALDAAIATCVLGKRVSDVARATERYASKFGYSVAREYTGHGVGRKMHEPPQVPNWWTNKRDRDGNALWEDYPLQVGMTFAIEPMLIMGLPELTVDADDWTVRTKRGALCAHFEHTIAVTDGAPLILTAEEDIA